MNAILIKILATALALSQVTTEPDAVKTQFDPVRDQAEVVQVLQAGCAHMRKVFDIESLNLDDLISTAMDDPQAVTGDIKVFRGINFADLYTAYKQFCRNETIANSPIDIGQVITFYNHALTDLPDTEQIKHLKLPGTSLVLDGKGARFAEIYQPGHRRVWVPLSDVPDVVQKAFVSAEDKRFYQHKGVDEHGLVRAFVGNLAHPGRPQGGSTITQQVAKNVLVGDEVSYERKIREVIVASRLERVLSKADILELYLNSIYLGRGAWGIEMASRSYFGKPAKALTLPEGALLASLAKGPAYFNPDRFPDRSRERVAYVLNRMHEDGYITAAQSQQAQAAQAHLAAAQFVRRDSGFHFVDQVAREARSAAGIASLTADSFTVRSTLNPDLQRATETALQEGLARYEINAGRVRFQGAEANLAEAVARLEADKTNSSTQAAWAQALENARLPLYDVHWTPAIVLPTDGDRVGGVRVGLADGRVLPLTTWQSSVRRALKPYDVIYVHVAEGKGRSARAELRVRPQVQGAALVLENKTGRILAMVGSFSYPLSQLNHTTQTQRQPGSALKPFTYLAALHHGLQPNTLVEDEPITLPPIGTASGAGSMSIMMPEDTSGREQDYWTPKNYDGTSRGVMTLRHALEQSRNQVTARLLDGGIEAEPEKSLSDVCALTVEAQVYKSCVPYYPFVLGAQPVRLIDLAAFYAAVANEGERFAPYAVESIEQNGKTVYQHKAADPAWLASGDRAAFYQLKTMLQGVVQRGTAYSLKNLGRYVAGKTGTSEDENDCWFVGFTNDVTIAVWVGYDNGDGKRRTLGAGQTGAKVAIPIFAPIVEASWSLVAPRTPLRPPSREAQRHLIALPIDLASGDRVTNGDRNAFMEYFRLGADGRFDETQYRLVSPSEAYSSRHVAEEERDGGPPGSFYAPYYRNDGQPRSGWSDDNGRGRYPPPPFWQEPPRRPPATFGGFLGELFGNGDDEREQYRARRADPYYWNRRPYN